ncbi:MAG: sugar transferase [Chitinophagaceae bacterium]|nr:sugar transferase [Chitinophagaceae bacterium]
MIETEEIKVIKALPQALSEIQAEENTGAYPFIKRAMDITIALVALLILSPLFLLVMVILWISGEHEVFYRQKRIGYRNDPFFIWKFATMVKNSPNMGTGEITLRNDPRVTPVGKFLRKSKINELPQIFNVLNGDMSIVGPRPLMEISFKLYSPQVQESIYQTRPGITGIASIVFRDEEKMLSEAKDARSAYAAIYPYKAKLEMWYQENISFATDIKIILLTAASILFPAANWVDKTFKNLPSRPIQRSPKA